MGDKHKGHKKDMRAGDDKQDEMKKAKNKAVDTSDKGHPRDMPGAAGFTSARADEDTYD